MKNTYQKGALSVSIIIIILLIIVGGFYFYAANRSDDAREGMMGENESSEANEPNEPVGFEEEPANLPPASVSAAVNVKIANFAFGPSAVTVKAGTTITWTNNDSAPHTATSASGLFNSGNLNKGQSFSFKFTEPGTYPYVCVYHPNMKATITVTP